MFVTNQTKINNYGLNNATIKQGIISTSSNNISTGDFIYKINDTENKYSNVVVLDGYSDPIYLSSPSTDVYTVACFKDKTLAIMDIGLAEKTIVSTRTFENNISDIVLYDTVSGYHRILVTTVGTSSTQYKHELTYVIINASTRKLEGITNYGAFGNYTHSSYSETDKFIKIGSYVYNIIFVSYSGSSGYIAALEVYQINFTAGGDITVTARNTLQIDSGGDKRYNGDINKAKAVKSTAYALSISYYAYNEYSNYKLISKTYTTYRSGNDLVLNSAELPSNVYGESINFVTITNIYNNTYYLSYYYKYITQPNKKIFKIILNTDNTINTINTITSKVGSYSADFSSLDTNTIGAILEYDSTNSVYYVNNFYTHKIDIYNTSLVKQTTYDNFTTGNRPIIFKPTNDRIVPISDFSTSTTTWKKYNCIVKQVNNYHYEEDNLNVGQTLNNYTPPFEISSNYIFTDTNGYYFNNREVIASTDDLSSVAVGDYCVTASSSTTLYQVYSVGSYYVNLMVIKSATKILVDTTTTYTKGNTYYGDINYVAEEQPEAGTIIDGSVSGNYVVIKASDDTLYYYEKITITSTGDNNTYYQILTFSNSNLTNAFSTTVSRIAKVTTLKRLEAMGIAINNGQPSDTIDYYTFNSTIST